MDDLTLCKRIAEIEGLEVTINTRTGYKECHHDKKMVFAKGVYGDYFSAYNPLTDDGLCFRLMIKHEIKVSTYYKIGDRVPFYGAETPDLEEVEARTPHKCVCLAIMSTYD